MREVAFPAPSVPFTVVFFTPDSRLLTPDLRPILGRSGYSLFVREAAFPAAGLMHTYTFTVANNGPQSKAAGGDGAFGLQLKVRSGMPARC